MRKVFSSSYHQHSIHENTTEAYQVPESTTIVDQYGLLGPDSAPTTDLGVGFNFSAGELLNIKIAVNSSIGIDFFVNSGSNGLSDSISFSTNYLIYKNITSVEQIGSFPKILASILFSVVKTSLFLTTFIGKYSSYGMKPNQEV